MICKIQNQIYSWCSVLKNETYDIEIEPMYTQCKQLHVKQHIITLSVGGSCFSRYFRSLDIPGGIALSFACFSFSKINDAVGACVNGLGKCLSSSDTEQ